MPNQYGDYREFTMTGDYGRKSYDSDRRGKSRSRERRDRSGDKRDRDRDRSHDRRDGREDRRGDRRERDRSHDRRDRSRDRRDRSRDRRDRSYDRGDRGGGGGRRGEPPAARPGSWACPKCSFDNFSTRGSCMRCQEPCPGSREYSKQSDQELLNEWSDARARRDFQTSDTIREELHRRGTPLPGEWKCRCGFLNFANRFDCKQCGARPGNGRRSSSRSGSRDRRRP
eukprot:TRINITY_DN5273_c0_g1_i2.p2 TRINITY_DN5273_c0_g1~~TRINITY_DN5273_c0_g1_i2.p2  ORF type:complete len:256 (+),score=59.46 TRINITY_DN5273_c0_g1_i2:89-769(+)